MTASNLVILSSTQGLLNATGDPVLGTSYTQAIGSLYTVAIYASNLTGRVYIEGSLATHPTSNDWFPVQMSGQVTDYIEFPYSGEYSTTNGGLQLIGFNFKGNLTWVRARLDRDYLNLGSLTSNQIAAYGFVDKVLLSIGGTVGVIDESTPSVGIESVVGHNLGSGAQVYSGFSGDDNVLLNFRTLVEGSGITMVQSGSTITINSTGGGSTLFTELTDAPDTIVSNAVLIGGSNAITFTSAPTGSDKIMKWTGTGFVWVPLPVVPDFVPSTVTVKDEGSNVVTQASILNFVGNAVVVSNVGGVATVTVNHQPPAVQTDVEYVVIQYTAGASGVLNSSDALLSQTSGVDVTFVDTNNCILAFDFSGRTHPPTSISVMGQVYSTNEFNYANLNPTLGTRKVQSGGTSSSPTLMTAFSGPITLQLRMSDTGASASVGQRAKAVIMFKF